MLTLFHWQTTWQLCSPALQNSHFPFKHRWGVLSAHKHQSKLKFPFQEKQSKVIRCTLQVLFPGLGPGECLNNASFFWAFLCPCWCKPWILTNADWEFKEGHYTALKISSSMAVQELKLEFSFLPTVCIKFGLWFLYMAWKAACWVWVSSLFLSHSKNMPGKDPIFPSPSFNPFCPPVQLTKPPNERKHSFPIARRAFTSVENVRYIFRSWKTRLAFP